MKGRTTLYVTGLTVALASIGLWEGFASPVTALAEKGGKSTRVSPNARVRLCVTFDDLIGDKIQSDALGPYCDGDIDTIDPVTLEPDSWINSNSAGGFALTTAAAEEGRDRFWRANEQLTVGGRMVFLDFTDWIGSLGNRPFATGFAEVQMYLRDLPEGADLRTMLPGTVFPATLVVRFSPTPIASEWRIVFGRRPGGAPPDSDFIQVTAGEDLDGDSFADEWTIQTTGASVGHLAKQIDRAFVYQGDFHLPCGMTVTKLP